MNVVIPMAGESQRFKKSKYELPKHLIKLKEKPMIQWAIESLGLVGTYHFIVRNDFHYSQVFDLLKKIVPDCKIITVDETTAGPASSCLLFHDSIGTSEELVIANCDQIMQWDSELFLNSARFYKYDGLVVTYTNTSDKNSYAKVNRDGFVVKIREKEVLSDISLNGIHYWKKGIYFIDSALDMIDANDTAPNGEFYVGPTYNYMINKGFNVGIHHIPNEQHNAVGTPEDLDIYKKKMNIYENN